MTPPGLTFSALGVDALDVLRALGDDARRATWRLDPWVEATGSGAAARVHALAESGDDIGAEALWPLLDDTQLIGGRITGALGGDPAWVVIGSIRGDAWDVRSADPRVLARVAARYPGAAPLPG